MKNSKGKSATRRSAEDSGIELGSVKVRTSTPGSLKDINLKEAEACMALLKSTNQFGSPPTYDEVRTADDEFKDFVIYDKRKKTQSEADLASRATEPLLSLAAMKSNLKKAGSCEIELQDEYKKAREASLFERSNSQTNSVAGSDDDLSQFDEDEDVTATVKALRTRLGDLPSSSELEMARVKGKLQSKYRGIYRKEKRAKKMAFEDVLTHIGALGKWQWTAFFVIACHQVPHSMFNLSTIFMMYSPDHWCKIDGFQPADMNALNTTWDIFRSSGFAFPQISHEENNTGRSKDSDDHHCRFFERNYGKYKGLTFQEIQDSRNETEELESRVCNEFVYDTSVMKQTIISEHNLVCNKSDFVRASVHMAYTAGYIVGAPLGGFLSDKVGRQKSLLICSIISAAFGVLLPFVKEYPPFLIVRFCLALSNEAADLCAFTYVLEITVAKYRAMIGTAAHVPWAVGYTFLALFAALFKDWRTIHYISLGLHFCSLIPMYLMLDESPRWCLANDRLGQAEDIIRKASVKNKKPIDADLKLIENDEGHAYSGMHIVRFYNIMKDFPKLRYLFLRIFYVWGATALCYYGLVIALSDQSVPGRQLVVGSFFINTAFAGFIEFPTLAVCMWMLYKGGRKQPLSITLASGGVLLIACILTNEYLADHLKWLSLVAMIITKSLVQCSFNILYIYTTEITPTQLRNTGLGLASMVARVAALGSGILAIQAHQSLASPPMVIFAVTLVIGGVMAQMMPATEDTPLPDTIDDAVDIIDTANSRMELASIAEEDESQFEEDQDDFGVVREMDRKLQKAKEEKEKREDMYKENARSERFETSSKEHQKLIFRTAVINGDFSILPESYHKRAKAQHDKMNRENEEYLIKTLQEEKDAKIARLQAKRARQQAKAAHAISKSESEAGTTAEENGALLHPETKE